MWAGGGGVTGWGQSEAGFKAGRCSISTMAFIRDPQGPFHHSQPLANRHALVTQRKPQLLDIRLGCPLEIEVNGAQSGF